MRVWINNAMKTLGGKHPNNEGHFVNKNQKENDIKDFPRTQNWPILTLS